MNDKTAKLIDTAIDTIVTTTPILGPVAHLLKESTKDTGKAIDNGNIESLNEEVHKQEIMLKIAHMQAKVYQELAISQRIANAEEVEIEEYYEGSGKGSAGLNIAEQGTSLGLSGEGQKVVKRVYRFKGNRDNEDS